MVFVTVSPEIVFLTLELYFTFQILSMKTIPQRLASYLLNNFVGNFLGFIVGMASTRLVSHFFATKSIRNLWGLTTRKTLVDKQTFSLIEVTISILIGFIVFEIISKGVQKKINEMLPSWKLVVSRWFVKSDNRESYTGQEALAQHESRKQIHRDVQ
jgi:hypothetical protein